MGWVKENAITLIILITSLAISWGSMSYRVDAISDRMDKYPSQDWFDLKFKNIDDGIGEIRDELHEHEASMSKEKGKYEK